MKVCIECKHLKETVTPRSNYCSKCFEALIKVKIKEEK